MPKHSHDETHLALLFAGSIESFSYNQSSVVSPSELLFVPAGETHTSKYNGSVHAFYIQFRESWWERLQPNMPSLHRAHEYSNSRPAWFAMRIYQEFQQRDNLTPFMLEGLTLELLVTMSRYEDDLLKSRGRSLPAWLNQVRDYLHSHFTESLSIDDVAQSIGVHPSHLMRGFRQYYHCTIGDYLRKLRIEQACRLLSRPDQEQSLAQIALGLGFADQSHFCKTFKQITGMTPTDLRNLHGHASLTQNALS